MPERPANSCRRPDPSTPSRPKDGFTQTGIPNDIRDLHLVFAALADLHQGDGPRVGVSEYETNVTTSDRVADEPDSRFLKLTDCIRRARKARVPLARRMEQLRMCAVCLEEVQ
jgi:hypothetical protein